MWERKDSPNTGHHTRTRDGCRIVRNLPRQQTQPAATAYFLMKTVPRLYLLRRHKLHGRTERIAHGQAEISAYRALLRR